MELQNCVIVDGVRSPFTRGGRGAFVATRLDEVAVTVLQTLLERNSVLSPYDIEDLGLGNVGGVAELAGIGGNHIARLAGLPEHVCSFDSNRQCGSSMETLQRIAQEVMVGQIDVGISMGIERMGRQLGGGGGGEKTRITEFNEGRLEQNPQQHDLAPDHMDMFSVPFPDYILDSSPIVSMTQTAQNVAEVYDLTRRELDEFAVDSHKKYGDALEAGFYEDEIVPFEVELPVFNEDGELQLDQTGERKTVSFDEGYRAGTNFEKLSELPTIRGLVSHGNKELVITAGNSCPTNDGVTAALLMNENKAKELGLKPLARIVGFGVGGVKPQVMGLGPVPATVKAMNHAGITADQIDRVEFNEAFAAQVIPSISDLGIPMERVNVNGGSLAIGHPLGATGTRLVTTVARELKRSGGKYGLATQCIGAGMGISTIVEAVD
jgi:acetyl-CoA acetyltransferase family protein